VVVGDVVGVEAAGERAGLRYRQPLAVRLGRLAREDRRERGRDPARLEVCRRVGPGADLYEAVLLAGRQQRFTDALGVLPQAEQLEAGLAGHTVAQRVNFETLDLEARHVEELDI